MYVIDKSTKLEKTLKGFKSSIKSILKEIFQKKRSKRLLMVLIVSYRFL